MVTIYEEAHFEDGSLHTRTPYVGGVIHGVQEIYYRSGEILYKTSYVNGKMQGAETMYWSTGVVRMETNYESDLANDFEKEYDSMIEAVEAI